MFHEFKTFALKGNVLDLAVGVVIGTAFSAIVASLVGDVIMPIVGVITGGIDFSGLHYTVGGATINYGKFIQALFIFLVVAFTLFVVVKVLNKLRKKEEKEHLAASPEPAPDVLLLTEIRDLLKK